MRNVRGLWAVRTPQKAGVRSIPRQQSSRHLALHVLDNERERLEKEIAMLAKRKETTEKRLRDIERRIESLQMSKDGQEASEASRESSQAESSRKAWNTMKLTY